MDSKGKENDILIVPLKMTNDCEKHSERKFWYEIEPNLRNRVR